MAATAARRRPDDPPTIPVLATAALLLVAGAGCGGPSDVPRAREPASPTSTPALAGEAQGGGSPAPFPVSVPEYAHAAVTAWAAPDLLRLADLTTAEVHEEIIELPGPPDQTWAFLQCDDEDPGWACAFYNTDGDYLVLTLDPDRLGEPRAVVDFAFEPTTYPTTAREYAEAFITAWQTGNRARMAALATPEVIRALDRLTPAPATGYELDEGDDPLVGVVVEFAEAEITLQLSLARLGESRAVRSAAVAE